MTCPICAFPGNDAAAVRCANCGFSMRPAPPNPEPTVLAAYDVDPVSGPPPFPADGWPQERPVSPGPVPVSPYAAFAPPISGVPLYRPQHQPPLPMQRQQHTRMVVPLTVIVVVLVVASTVIAVVRLTGGTAVTPAAAGMTTGAGWGTPPGAMPGSPPDSQPGSVPGAVSPAAAAPGSQADPRAQAAALDAVLDASGASRTKLNDAIRLVEDCTLIEKAIGDLRAAGTERQAQLDSVAAFDLTAIPEGEQLRALFTEALQHSLAADRSFVLWGQAVQGSGCDGGGRGDYQEAQRRSKLAGDAKARFVAAWNPVAARHGLRQRAATDV